METKIIRVWQIGPDGTECFAGHSEEEVERYYREMLGERDREQADEDLSQHFTEVTNLDEQFEFDDDGEKKWITFRQLAEIPEKLPCQISSGYN